MGRRRAAGTISTIVEWLNVFGLVPGPAVIDRSVVACMLITVGVRVLAGLVDICPVLGGHFV